MNTKYEQLFKIIEHHDSICIFGHCFPDGDCYGSSQGLKELIKYMYPNKKVCVLGTDIYKLPPDFPRADIVKDEIIENSLVITVDLPDKARVSDKRCFSLSNKGLIKIDHHIFKEHFGELEIIEDEASSCCEILAKIFYEKMDKLPQLACDLLYYGFTTDTNRFMYSNRESALIGAKLIANGANCQKIYNCINQVAEKSVKFLGYMYSHYQKTRLGVSYLIVPYEEGKKYGYDPHSIAVFVNSIGRIQSSRMWVVIAQTSDNKAFCEFRSVGNIDVQKIASKFTGGGHFNASGCTLSSFDRADEVIEECEKVLLDTFAPYQKELSTMLDLAEKSSNIIMDVYSKGFDVEIKSDNSPVTTADKKANKLIRDTLLKTFPNYGILTEEDEDNKERLNKEFVFIVDPLDGTKDFVNKDDMFATNIALCKNGEPFVGVISIPAKGEIYFAVKDKGTYLYTKNDMIRQLHVSYKKNDITVYNSCFHQNQKYLDIIKNDSNIKEIKYVGSALKTCLIAKGEGEICYSLGEGTKEWDVCAPDIILKEAGGLFLSNHLQEFKYNKDDVYNHDGFIAMNSKDNLILNDKQLEEVLKK